MKRYKTSPSPSEKTIVVSGIVHAIRNACPSGGFLKLVGDKSPIQRYESLGWNLSHAKTGHAMRNMIDQLKDDEKAALRTPPTTLEPLTKSNDLPLDMSVQQHLVLRRLEAGFDGSVEDLLFGTTGTR